MIMPESSFGIADLELKEDSNEISFRVIGSANEVDVVVKANGVEMWSELKHYPQNLHDSTFQLKKYSSEMLGAVEFQHVM